MGLALEEAQRMKLPLPGLTLVHAIYVRAQQLGYGRKGTQALYLALEEMAKTPDSLLRLVEVLRRISFSVSRSDASVTPTPTPNSISRPFCVRVIDDAEDLVRLFRRRARSRCTWPKSE